MKNSALDRIAALLARFGLQLPTGLTDPDQFADLVTVAALNAGRGREWKRRRKARLSLNGPWDESKHPRGQPENAGQFAPRASATARTAAPKTRGTKSIAVTPQGALNPDGSSRATRKPTAAAGAPPRGSTSRGAKHVRKSVARSYGHFKRLEAAWERASEAHFELADRLEAALEDPTADPAAVARLRRQAQVSEKRFDALYERQEAAKARARAIFLRLMSGRVRHPARLTRLAGAAENDWTAPHRAEPTAAQQAIFDAAHEFVASVCGWPPGAGAVPAYRTGAAKNGRACYFDGDGGAPVIAMSDAYERESHDDATRIHVHEIGHMLEKRRPGVLAKTRAFLARRTAGEAFTKLKDAFPDHGYGDDEYGRKDDFDRALSRSAAFYTGKDYGESTEVLSVGLEQLHRDPGRLAATDPDWFENLVEWLTK